MGRLTHAFNTSMTLALHPAVVWLNTSFYFDNLENRFLTKSLRVIMVVHVQRSDP